MGAVFNSLSALRTAIAEDCEHQGKTFKYLFPYTGNKRPLACVCDCGTRRKVDSVKRQEDDGVRASMNVSCSVNTADGVANAQAVHQGVAFVACEARGGASRAHARGDQWEANVHVHAEGGERSSARADASAKAGCADAPPRTNEELGVEEESASFKGNPYLRHEFKVRNGEACSFWLVSSSLLATLSIRFARPA